MTVNVGGSPAACRLENDVVGLVEGADGDQGAGTVLDPGFVVGTGLPRRDNGAYYEAWVKDSTGALVPVGTFNQPDDVTLWAGVPPASHPTFTVTRQLANGDPASTGQVVLLGTAHLNP